MKATWRSLHISPRGCGMYPQLDPSSPAASGVGYGYTCEGVGYVNHADTPEDSAGDGGVDEEGDGFGGLPAFVSSVSAGEVDAIVQRLTPTEGP